jgi:hypothetical protein
MEEETVYYITIPVHCENFYMKMQPVIEKEKNCACDPFAVIIEILLEMMWYGILFDYNEFPFKLWRDGVGSPAGGVVLDDRSDEPRRHDSGS